MNVLGVSLRSTVFLLLLADLASSEQDYVKSLRTAVLSDYDKMVVPSTQNATLNLRAYLEHFQVDERGMTFSSKMLLTMWWNDPRVKWDPRAYGRLLELTFSSDELWKPELTVYNDAAKRKFGKNAPVPIRAHWNGNLFWYPPTEFNTSCSHNVKNWPFDSSVCWVMIGSWIWYGLRFVDYPANVDRLKPNGEWEVTRIQSGVHNNIFECCPEYQSYSLVFHLKRQSAYSFAIVCVPGIAIAIAVLSSFWMNPKSPERTGLLLISLLVNTFYLKFVYDMIPPNGDDVPYIILYYKNSLAMIVVAILWTVCSRFIASTTRTSNVPLPGVLLTFLESWPSKLMCIVSRPSKGPQNTSSMTEDDSSLIGLQSLVVNDWSWLAHLLDRIMFLVYDVTYVIFILAFL